MGKDVFMFEWDSAGVKSDKGSDCIYRLRPEVPSLVPFTKACRDDQQGGWYADWINLPNEIPNHCNGDEGSDNMGYGPKGCTCAAWIIRNGWKFPSDYPWAQVSKKPDGFHR